MPTKRLNYGVKTPFRGMLSGNNPTLDPTFFTKAHNIFFDKQGTPEKRPGVTKISDPVIYTTSMFQFNDASPATIVENAPGAVWTDLGQQSDVRTIDALVYLENGIALAGTHNLSSEGIILRSTDYGENWTDLGQIAGAEEIYALAYLGSGIVLAGGDDIDGDRMFRSTDYGATWADLGQLSGDLQISSLVSLGSGIALAGTHDGGKILRSTDYGENWTDLGQQGAEHNVASLVSLGSGIALAGTVDGGKIFRSEDYGENWTDLGQQGGEPNIRSLVSLGAGIALAGTHDGGKILRSIDYGITWTDLGQQGAEETIYSLAYLGDGIVVAGTAVNGKIFRSTDYGETWTDLGTQGFVAIISLAYLENGITLAGMILTGHLLYSAGGGTGFANFRAGLKIKVSGTVNNDGVYDLHSIADNTLTLATAETLVNETSGIATIYLLAKIDGFYEYIKQGTTGSPSSFWIFNIDKYIIASNRNVNPDIANAIKSDCTPGQADYVVLQDKLYIANGQDVLQVYTGTGDAADIAPVEEEGGPPGEDEGLTNGIFSPAFIEVHQWCLWAAGIPGHPSRIYKSAALDGTDFRTNYAAMDVTFGYALAGAAAFDIRPDDGTKITGLIGDFFGQLLIFKEKSIYRVLGSTKADFVMPPEGIIRGIGGYNGSIVVAHNEVYFMSLKGFHDLSTVERFGDNAESYLSLNIQEFFDGLDKGQFDECSACHWESYNIILWSLRLKGAGNNNIIFIYNYLVKAWSITTEIEMTALSLMNFHNRREVFLGDSHSRFCRFNPQMMNDYGSAFTAELETTFDLQDPYLVKAWRSFFLNFNPVGGSVSVKYKVDDGSWSETKTFSAADYVVLGNFLLGTDSLIDSISGNVDRCEINKNGKKLTVNIQNANLNEKMSIFGFGGQYLPVGYY